jgi:hypothetical protein
VNYDCGRDVLSNGCAKHPLQITNKSHAIVLPSPFKICPALTLSFSLRLTPIQQTEQGFRQRLIELFSHLLESSTSSSGAGALDKSRRNRCPLVPVIKTMALRRAFGAATRPTRGWAVISESIVRRSSSVTFALPTIGAAPLSRVDTAIAKAVEEVRELRPDTPLWQTAVDAVAAIAGSSRKHLVRPQLALVGYAAGNGGTVEGSHNGAEALAVCADLCCILFHHAPISSFSFWFSYVVSW